MRQLWVGGGGILGDAGEGDKNLKLHTKTEEQLNASRRFKRHATPTQATCHHGHHNLFTQQCFSVANMAYYHKVMGITNPQARFVRTIDYLQPRSKYYSKGPNDMQHKY